MLILLLVALILPTEHTRAEYISIIRIMCAELLLEGIICLPLVFAWIENP